MVSSVKKNVDMVGKENNMMTGNKTLREYVNEFEPTLKEKVLANMIRTLEPWVYKTVMYHDRCKSPHEALICSFSFIESLEGWDYWEAQVDEMVKQDKKIKNGVDKYAISC